MTRIAATTLGMMVAIGGCSLQSHALPTETFTDAGVTDTASSPEDSSARIDVPNADAGDTGPARSDASFDTSGSGWLVGYLRRKRIVVSSREVSTPTGQTVIGVKMLGDTELRDHLDAAANEVAFAAADGVTPLPHEVERYRATNGDLTAWVRLPGLPAGAETVLYVYYDAPGAASKADPHATWDSYARGVWHMTAHAGRGIYDDSTSAANHGAPVSSGQEPSNSAGIAGRSREFDGSDDQISLGDPADGSLDFGTSSFSFSVWVHIERAVERWDMPWNKGGACAGCNGYDMELGTSSWRAHISDGTVIRGGNFGTDPMLDGRWVHLVAVVDRGEAALVLYTDGAETDRVDITGVGSVDTDANADIGFARYPLLGRIDEVRVYARALTAGEVSIEHDNLTDPSFLRVDAEETRP